MVLVDFKILTFADELARWGDANVKINPLVPCGARDCAANQSTAWICEAYFALSANLDSVAQEWQAAFPC